LEFLFSNWELADVDLEKLAEKTESFVVRDMADLANKTLFESYQEGNSVIFSLSLYRFY
jgi:SpoVK/Ycf46/Vps4 family AAA+-type ATPase